MFLSSISVYLAHDQAERDHTVRFHRMHLRRINPILGRLERADIQQGDEFKILEHKGNITLIRQTSNASHGVLAHLKAQRGITETDSRDESMRSSN